ncbi:hypothetical protein VCHC55C2_0536 [Vibrio cholerae HC-55C2]|nr:hypothetical protein FORC55_2309 [Vibrio cholerae]AYC06232.1 hypothetical protein FORC73_2270 [Vibrio cholerae]EKG64574.1 hypothetical protein VCHC55A1_0535 [Vibrio cholerae HC-55A1]EKL08971.1 hypothetical protein VCHC55C2_0536 [Vibrio cholerae HC-55C2]EKM09280.1 hypothetical protein VCHC59B1_0536 [Vibrio cholerae HC-59B1]
MDGILFSVVLKNKNGKFQFLQTFAHQSRHSTKQMLAVQQTRKRESSPRSHSIITL